MGYVVAFLPVLMAAGIALWQMKKRTQKLIKYMDCFRFKLNENICLDADQDKDIIYVATLSKDSKEIYNISWHDPLTHNIEEVEYHKDTVEEALKKGNWIIINKVKAQK